MSSNAVQGVMKIQEPAAASRSIEPLRTGDSVRTKFSIWRSRLTRAQRGVLLSTVIATLSLTALLVVGLQLATLQVIFR